MTGKHPLREITKRIIPPDSGIRRPERWVTERLLDGRFRGQKIGREWYMSDADIQAAEEFLYRSSRRAEAAPTVEPAVSIVEGLSARSRRRVRRPA